MERRILSLVIFLAAVTMLGTAYADMATFNKQMQPVLEQYLKITDALAADKTDGVATAAGEITKLASKLDAKSVKGAHAGHFKNMPENISAGATKLAAAKDLAGMREALKDLSKPMAMWATMIKPKGISVMYCSMAPGSWLQKDDTTIANPYYGSQMLRCGEIVAGNGAKAEAPAKKDDHAGHKH